MQDFFGILDAVKRLTAPAGLENAHQDGFSWARDGVDFATSTKLTADDYNRIIAQLRGVITATPGFDTTGRDPSDPLLLRDAIIDFATAKIVELLPDVVLDQADELAAAMASITAFVNAVVAAVPTNLNASNLTAGTVPDGRLPGWTRPLSTAATNATDFDAITANGWHGNLLGTNNPNIPAAGYYFVLVLGHSVNLTQIAFPYSASVSGYGIWIRGRYNGVWTGWVRIGDKTYNDTLYLAKAGGALTGGLTGTTLTLSGLAQLNGGASTLVGGSGALNTLSTPYYSIEVRGTSVSGGAFIGLHRSGGSYAVLFGLDTDNRIKVGGWSMGNASYELHHDGNSSRGSPDAVLEDQKASGTAAQTSTAAAYTIRDLNTEVSDRFGLMTLASNLFTPSAAGWVEWETAVQSANGTCKSRLYNVTDAVVAGVGLGCVSNGQFLTGGAPVLAGKQYRLEVYTTAAQPMTQGTTSLGAEIYSRVSYWRN